MGEVAWALPIVEGGQDYTFYGDIQSVIVQLNGERVTQGIAPLGVRKKHLSPSLQPPFQWVFLSSKRSEPAKGEKPSIQKRINASFTAVTTIPSAVLLRLRLRNAHSPKPGAMLVFQTKPNSTGLERALVISKT
ncbi:hypothetical protein GGR57DRAFT_496321 [Xylariaceae sp. FL1272]|nr:hypothetical protein GGR57DRAFT_496321 [Xylariaceae sp. FL1272]